MASIPNTSKRPSPLWRPLRTPDLTGSHVKKFQLQQLADTLDISLPSLSSVFSIALNNLVTSNRFDEESIAKQIAETACRYKLPRHILQDLHSSLSNIISSTVKMLQLPEQQDGEHENTCYWIFHEGDFHFYYEEFPEKILRRKNQTLFWIMPHRNEFLTLGEVVSKENYLEPRTRNLLIYLGSQKVSGKRIRIEDIYREVWFDSSPIDQSKISNLFYVIQNKINCFALEKFISTKPTPYVQRIHGSAELIIGKKCVEAICLSL